MALPLPVILLTLLKDSQGGIERQSPCLPTQVDGQLCGKTLGLTQVSLLAHEDLLRCWNTFQSHLRTKSYTWKLKSHPSIRLTQKCIMLLGKFVSILCDFPFNFDTYS